MGKLTPDEVLEQQRTEATKVYAKTVADLQGKANDLDKKCKDLKRTIDDALNSKIKELKEMEEKLTVSLADAEHRKAEAQALMREARDKINEANKLEKIVQEKHDIHQETIDTYHSSIDFDKEIYTKKNTEILEREQDSILKQRQLEEKESCLLKKEEEINSKIEELNILKEHVDKNIQENKNIKNYNDIEIEKLSKLDIDLKDREEKLFSDRRQFSLELNDFEINRSSLAKRKLELDQKNDWLKNESIKNELAIQKLQAKEKEIQTEYGKLNELKNNVEILMKNKEESKGV